ncbi:MAG: hypothetical protein ACM3TU_02960 [Bacillota bacterium]
MTRERAPRIPSPSPEERERSRRAYQEADPTTYSELRLQGHTKDLGTVAERGEDYFRENQVIGNRGEQFYELDKIPMSQQVAARLLKGIINVSDVVSDGDPYWPKMYSKRMPLSKVAETLDPEEVVADTELINLILGDIDHIAPMHNVRVEEGKAAYFDFGGAEFKTGPMSLRNSLSERSLTRLADHVQELKKRYLSAEGKEFARAIYAQGEQYPDTDIQQSFDDFYAVLSDRILKAEELVERRLGSRKRAA